MLPELLGLVDCVNMSKAFQSFTKLSNLAPKAAGSVTKVNIKTDANPTIYPGDTANMRGHVRKFNMLMYIFFSVLLTLCLGEKIRDHCSQSLGRIQTCCLPSPLENTLCPFTHSSKSLGMLLQENMSDGSHRQLPSNGSQADFLFPGQIAIKIFAALLVCP